MTPSVLLPLLATLLACPPAPKEHAPDTATPNPDSGPLPPAGDEDGDGYERADGDCDDQDPAVNPGAPELCNGLDYAWSGLSLSNEADALSLWAGSLEMDRLAWDDGASMPDAPAAPA